jgi:hypothetical protein
MDNLIQLFSDNSNALIVSLIANAMSAIAVWYVKKGFPKWRHSLPIIIGIVILTGSIALYLIVSIIKAPKRAEAVFSDFNNCFAINTYKVHWGVLNDNPYNGNSNVTVEVPSYRSAIISNDCYAILSYYLGDKSTIRPYCGIFSWFVPKPIEARDVSSYNGIQLEAWPEVDLPEGVRVYLQISPYKLIHSYEGYLECDITSDIKNNSERREISLHFSKFKSPPSWTGPTISLSKEFQKSIYQISIIIQGEKGRIAQGKIGIDNLKFF